MVEFIAATRATFRPCMGLLSARCSSSGGSTWRLQSVCKLLANPTFTSLNIPWGNETEALDSSKQHGDRKIKLLQWTVPLTSLHLQMECRSVSCLWRLRLPTSVGLLCPFECRSHQAHRCMFPHFRPPVTLSTVSWFCCRSRCRPVSSWCRVSLLPLELRRPSPRTQSP